MSTRHIAAEHTRLADLTPVGSSGGASKRFRQKLAADGFTVDDGFRLKPGYLYTVVRAISARVNQNYDGWPSEELKKAYKTFIGKPVFVNHENHDPTKARGVVVASRYVENGMDKYIEVVQEIDAGRFPKLAHEIKTGGLDSVSMGAEAGFTICSYCHNKATDLHDMCEHVQLHKGKTLRKFDRRTGNTEDILVFESCHKISFFELSYVFEPADETAVASKVVVARLKTAGDEGFFDSTAPLTDDNGKTHNSHCVNQAFGSISQEAGLSGFESPDDLVESWSKEYNHPHTVSGVLRTWLSDGTTDCHCQEEEERLRYRQERGDKNASRRTAAWGSTPHGDLTNSMGDGHQLHVFSPHVAPAITDSHPILPGESIVPEGGSRQHEWVHTQHGEPVNGGFAASQQEAVRAAEQSHQELAGLNKKVNGWASRKREDPRNETDEAPGLTNGKFSAVNLSRNVPYVGHNIPVSEGNYYRSLHTDSFDSLFDKDGVMRGNGRGGTDNLSFMSGNPLEMYTNGITKSNTIIEGDSRLPISSTDKRSGYSYVPQLNRTDVDSGVTPLRVWRRKAVGSEPIESVHNWEKVYDSFPSEHRQAGKHTKQGFAADIAEITKLAGGWDPDADVFDPRTFGASRRTAAWGSTPHGDLTNSMGDGHQLHVFSPHVAPAITDSHPILPGESIVPEGGSRQHEWVHTQHGEPVNGGFAASQQEAVRAAEQSHQELAGLNKKVNGWASRKREDPRNETDEAPGLTNGKFSAVNLSRNVPYVGHNIPVSEGNYYRSLHTDSFDSLFDKDGVMRGNGRGGTDNLSFMSGNPLEMYTNGITKSNTIIEGDSRLPISSTDKRSGYSYVPQLNRTDVDSGVTPLRVWRRKAVGSEPIESVHNWEKVYDSFPSEHRQAGKHTKQGFAADIAEITKLAGGWDPDADVFDPRTFGASRRTAAWGSTQHGDLTNSMGDGHQLHVFSPHVAPAITDSHPIQPGESIVPEGGSRQHEWVHTQHGEPVNGGFAASQQEAVRAAEQSHQELAGGWDPDADVFDPREFGASRRTAEDLTVPAPPGTPTIPQSVIDATPVIELNPATELTGHEAPGVPKQSGKYTKEDFAAAGGKKPWENETAEDDDLKEIEAMIRQAGQCPPGQDCSNLAQGEQITKDSPNNPVNQVSSDPNGTGAAGGAGGNFGKPPAQQSGDNTGGSLKPQTQALQDSLKGIFPDAEIGGWREPDGYNEHSSGSALDFMTTDHGQAKQVMDHAFENGAKFVIWDQKQWNPDGSTSAMPDRGDPTQNHKDHVHINTGSRIATPTDDYESWKSEHGQAADEEGTHGITERFPSWEHKRWLDHQNKLQRKLTGVLHDLLHNGGVPIRSASRTAAPGGRVPRQLRGLVNSWVPLADAPPPDPQQPVFVHYNFPAVKRQKATGQPQPDLWSVEQEEVDPETGKKFHRVRGYTDQLHMSGGPGEDGRIKMRVDRGGAKRALGTGVRNVHAGPVGYLAPQPDQPIPYSKINYDPFRQFDPEAGESNFFFHEDSYDEPVWSAEEMHFSPNAQMHGSQADNWGRDRPPTVVFPTHPDLNASNADTVDPARQKQAGLKTMIRNTALRKTARRRALKLAFGEIEAPMTVDTLREEGSAPEDDDDDFEQYVKSPKDLQDPDLSQAQQIDREQEIAGAPTDTTGGVPGPAEGGPVPGQAPQQQYMTLQIPMPSEAPQVPQQAAPPVMMQPPADPAAMDPAAPQGPPQQIAASVLDYFDRYYGHRVANWMDAIEDGRAMNPAEAADYRRQAVKLSTLENGRELSTTTRNPTKGTANMARNSIANRNKVATAGRRQHFAEGPLVDGGPYGRNNQGPQEEAFISQTPPEEAGDFPTDDTPNISNTEHNLVARVQQGRAQLLRDAQQLASLRQRRGFDEAGGPTAEIVDPRVNTGPEGEKLTGTDFISADPNDGVVPTNPKDASLRAFQAFDGWLNAKTGKSSRRHTEATIKKAAAAFSREAGISPQALFPALGIVLREARKADKKATKGAAMRKRSNESLDVAAPGARIDVETPVKNTDAEAQASQFDLHDFGNNAGDNVADPDLSTDQNWAPGEASKTSARVKTAGGLLAMRCAEGMITAGLEPNSRERKYQLAAEFEGMNRGLIQDRVALLERFAAVRQADLRRVASGSSRGAARSPIPAGLGGGTRTAAAGQRLAAHDPSNDSSLFI